MFTKEEALASSLAYFDGDELAAKVFVGKYALKDADGNLLERDPSQMHRRIAKELARIEANYPNAMPEDEIFALLERFSLLVPQGSPMSGIGNTFQIVSLSNCFVVNGAADSYGGVMLTDQEQVQLMKRRGGVGHDLSGLRPKGSRVLNSAITSTGLVPFMERYSNSTREVAQDGRRGALMLSVSIKHPDAESFIDAKTDLKSVTGANVSVRVTDDFMRAVRSGGMFEQVFPVSGEPEVRKMADAGALWKKIIHNAWANAEPGVLFWDKIISESPADCYASDGFRTVSTNPCGEIPLCADDSCRLLAINLTGFVKHRFTDDALFDFEMLEDVAGKALRLMDDIVDLEIEKIDAILAKIGKDPESESVKRVERELWQRIGQKAVNGRRTGLGITALGDTLAMLGLRFGSAEGNHVATAMQKAIARGALKSSITMAKERGAFPIFDYDKEKDNPFICRVMETMPDWEGAWKTHGRRNIAMLTIAPTGTTSIMTQTTSGIEPAFMTHYKRRVKVNADGGARVDFVDDVGDSWQEHNVVHHGLREWALSRGISEKALESYSSDEMSRLVSESPYAGATANEIDWESKVRMQGELQRWVDHSISVTINLPSDVSEATVARLYETAWEAGCKGCTVYRDGSRSGVLVASDLGKKAESVHEEKSVPTAHGDDRSARPEMLYAEIVRFRNNEERWLAVVGLREDGTPYEIFTGREDAELLPVPPSITDGFVRKVRQEDGTSRYDLSYLNRNGYECTIPGLSHTFDPVFWNYAKLISGQLRHGAPVASVVKQVQGLHFEQESLNTWTAGVARALKRYVADGTRAGRCGSCGADALEYVEGCVTCKACGESKCG